MLASKYMKVASLVSFVIQTICFPILNMIVILYVTSNMWKINFKVPGSVSNLTPNGW